LKITIISGEIHETSSPRAGKAERKKSRKKKEEKKKKASEYRGVVRKVPLYCPEIKIHPLTKD
jgi:hypothetical protein